MKSFKKRWWSRFALISGIGMAQLVACSSDHSQGHADAQRTGTLGLSLEAAAQSGAVYRLRNATFIITDRHTGQAVDFLFSEDAPPTAAEITKVLQPGNYTVTLEDGWFIERVSTGGGVGGSAGTAGSSVGGAAGKGGTGGRGGRGGSAGRAGSVGRGGSPGTGGAGAIGGEAGAFEEAPVPTKSGVSAAAIGAGGEVGTGDGGTPVDAFLLSDAVQTFSIFGGDDEFVSYLFQIGGQVVDFNHGTLHVGIQVIEDPSACVPPPGVLDNGRVLLESNVDAVNAIGITDAFAAIVNNSGMGTDPSLLYQEIYDSYASPQNARLPNAVHCGDEMTNGVPTLNGFPITCDRIEHAHIDDEFNFFATAFVNRMDLAPENGAHCGQQRVIFANPSRGRAFMIMEPQIPNPHPELGIQGCAPLEQNDIDDPVARGQRLMQAFVFGDPDLAAAGFGPFLNAQNLTVGSGQIRTNQFDQSPWMLREFRLAQDGADVKVIPFPTSEAPNGTLWNDAIDTPQGPTCRQSFLDAVDQLLTNDVNALSFVVDQACLDGESRNDFSQFYDGDLGNGFRQDLEQRLAGTGLNADDLALRADFAGSCIGCHNEANGQFLGNGVFAPFSNDFTHVAEFTTACDKRNPGQCFQQSSALTQQFLPSRLQVMGQILDIPIVTDPCNGGGAGGAGGFGGSFGVGGTFTAGSGPIGAGGSFTAGSGPMGSGGTFTAGGRGPIGSGGMQTGNAGAADEESPPPKPSPRAASSFATPGLAVRLPSAKLPLAELRAEDARIRQQFGAKTLSGRSARSTH